MSGIATPVGRFPFVGPEAMERTLGARFVLRLGANESPFGPSPLALEAAERELSRASLYADAECLGLRRGIADLTGVPLERIAVGRGIDDLLRWAVGRLLGSGKVAVASAGTYPVFGQLVAGTGASLATTPYREDCSVDPSGLAALAHERRASVVYVANPDNPTGSALPESDLLRLLAELPRDCTLLLDEAYRDYAGPEISGDEPAAGDGRVLRFRTFSKGYGLAGLRVGYAIVPEGGSHPLAENEAAGVSRIALAAAEAALEDRSHLRRVFEEVVAGREQYAAMADELGWGHIPSSANFVALDPGGQRAADAWYRALIEAGVFVRRGFEPPLDRFLRITVGTGEERRRLAEIVRRVAASP